MFKSDDDRRVFLLNLQLGLDDVPYVIAYALSGHRTMKTTSSGHPEVRTSTILITYILLNAHISPRLNSSN